jgi:recombination protein RecT
MGTAIAKRDAKDLQAMLEHYRDKIAKVCAEQLDVSRQIQLAALCAYHQPKLLECDNASILNATMEASDLGLSLSRSSGEAYLVPRWNDRAKLRQCCFMAGYQGMVKLSYEAGTRYCHARAVCQHDEFEWAWDSRSDAELQYHHKLSRDGRRGEITHVYAVSKTPSGELIGECKTVEEIQAIRLRSQTPNEGPWVTDWEPMAAKTVFRGLYKWLPKSPRVLRAIESHDADFDFTQPSIDITPATTTTIAFNGLETVPTIPEQPAIAASSPAEAPPTPPTKAARLTEQLAARAAALKGMKPPLPQPAAAATATPLTPVNTQRSSTPKFPAWPPTNAQELADWTKATGSTFFAQYGRTRRYPVPMTSWSADHVRKAVESFEYERDVVKTIDAMGRWIQEPATAAVR